MALWLSLRSWIFDCYDVLFDFMTWRDRPSPAVVCRGSMAVRRRATISGKGVATSMAVLRHTLLDLRTGYAAVGREAVEHGSARWSSRIFTQLVAPLAIAINRGTSRACSLKCGSAWYCSNNSTVRSSPRLIAAPSGDSGGVPIIFGSHLASKRVVILSGNGPSSNIAG